MSHHPLARHVAVIVIVKVAIVIAAGIWVFGPKQRPMLDEAAVAQHLFAATPQAAPFKDPAR
ncbi:hypothetical protein BH10PSE17_BH10PSE17_20020 [soil metagenome]